MHQNIIFLDYWLPSTALSAKHTKIVPILSRYSTLKVMLDSIKEKKHRFHLHQNKNIVFSLRDNFTFFCKTGLLREVCINKCLQTLLKETSLMWYSHIYHILLLNFVLVSVKYWGCMNLTLRPCKTQLIFFFISWYI